MRKNKAVGRAGSPAAGWASLGRVGAGAYLLDGDGWPPVLVLLQDGQAHCA